MAIDDQLTGRTVLVTGAARGLGAAIARACSERGADLILTDLALADLAPLVLELGEQTQAFELDVTDASAWARLTDALLNGTGRPDVLVNNAGVVDPCSIGSMTYARFRHTVDVNLGGTFLGMKTFVDLHMSLPDARPGSIVNIASARGLVGAANASSYCASKFGVRGLTKAGAIELGPLGIRVNSVCPGPIETPMSRDNPDFADMDWDSYVARLPLGAMGQPVDVGQAVAWLASDASSFVTGIDLPVDGGLTATTHSIEKRLIDHDKN